MKDPKLPGRKTIVKRVKVISRKPGEALLPNYAFKDGKPLIPKDALDGEALAETWESAFGGAPAFCRNNCL